MANFAAAASLVLSVLALFVSVAIAVRQLRAAHNSNSISVMLELFGEYRSPEMLQARTVVLERLPSLKRHETELGWASLPTDVRDSALRTSHFFDNVGILVANDLIPPDPMIAFFGGSALNCWERMLPYISEERAKWGTPLYQAYFELFVSMTKKRDPNSVVVGTMKRALR
jgi:hypothetical protein